MLFHLLKENRTAVGDSDLTEKKKEQSKIIFSYNVPRGTRNRKTTLKKHDFFKKRMFHMEHSVDF